MMIKLVGKGGAVAAPVAQADTDQAYVVFYGVDGRRHLTVSMDRNGWFRVSGDDAISIQPMASNCILVR